MGDAGRGCAGDPQPTHRRMDARCEMNKAAQALGRLGGKAKSSAKAAAAKANGKRGGRPKKPKPQSGPPSIRLKSAGQ